MIAASFPIKLQYLDNNGVIELDTQLLLDPHSNTDPSNLPRWITGFRGSHLIRDPRDLLISAYFYHLRTAEAWCALPNPEHGSLPPDVSYQQHLCSLDQEQGLLCELNNVSGRIIQRMTEWDYSNPNILELRYEQVVGNERATFQRLFEWYGFNTDKAIQAADIADGMALKNADPNSAMVRHARPGSRIGQWQDYFTPAVKQAFKHKYGEALINLGYCKDTHW